MRSIHTSVPYVCSIRLCLAPSCPVANSPAPVGIIAKLDALRRDEGLSGLTRVLSYRFSEEWHDRRLNIRTPRGRISLTDYGEDHPDYIFHEVTPYAAIFAALEGHPRTDHDVLVDVGCGMGRVLAAAATKPFRRIIGVELVQSFVDEARENLRRAKPRLRCRDVEVIQANALDFEFPDDMTVAHFFNPFRGATLGRVVDKLKDSLVRVPRTVDVLFANPVFFEEVIAGQEWVRFIREVPWPHRPPMSEPFHNSYGIYTAKLVGL